MVFLCFEWLITKPFFVCVFLVTACSVTWGFPLLYSQSCWASVLAKHSLKRQCMVWQKLSRRDFGEANRQLDSGTLSDSSVKWSQVSWIVSGSSCWNSWTHTKTHTETDAWVRDSQVGLMWSIYKCHYHVKSFGREHFKNVIIMAVHLGPELPWAAN